MSKKKTVAKSAGKKPAKKLNVSKLSRDSVKAGRKNAFVSLFSDIHVHLEPSGGPTPC